MGWTFVPTGKSVKAFVKEQLDFNDGTNSGEVIEIAVVDGFDGEKVAYCAYATHVEVRSPKDHVAGMVVLINTKQEKGSIGYKDMHECEGPLYRECPASILEKLTEPVGQFAWSWRKECYENLMK